MAFQIQGTRYIRTIKCYKNQTYMFYFLIIIHSDALCSIDCQWDKVFSNVNRLRTNTKTNSTFAKHIMIKTWASTVMDSKGCGFEIDLTRYASAFLWKSQ